MTRNTDLAISQSYAWRWTSLSNAVAACLFSFMMLLPATAEALSVTHIFEGDISVANPEAGFGDALGARFKYTINYDTRIQREDGFLRPGQPASPVPVLSNYEAQLVLVDPPLPGGVFLEYANPTSTFELAVGSETVAASLEIPDTFTADQILALWQQLGGRPSRVTVSNNSTIVIPPRGPSVPADFFLFESITLIDSTETAFANTMLPLSLNIEDFDFAQFRYFTVLDGSVLPVFGLLGTIDRITSSVVPEPASALLLGLGLMGLTGLSRRGA